MTVEERLLKELEEKDHLISELQKQADENAQYRAIIENKMNRKAKDSVFLDLFSRPEYQIQLYRELFPNDTDIQASDLELFSLDSILTNHPYNDIGLLARQKLIVLAEAESDWSVNIVYRMAGYFFDTMNAFLHRTGMNVHHKTKIALLDVEAFVIYPGPQKIVRDTISLRDEFYGGDPRKPDFSARVIHGDYKGGIIAEYMGFCRVLDEQRAIHKNDPEPQKWIEATIEICVEKGFLTQYLNDHKPEVEKIMIEMYNPRYVAEAERKTEIMLAEIGFARAAGVSDEKIIELLVQRHGTTPAYARNLLDYRPDDHVVDAV